jgi:hypothetical protein
MNIKRQLDKIRGISSILQNLNLDEKEQLIDSFARDINETSDIIWFIENYRFFLESEIDSIISMVLFKNIAILSTVCYIFMMFIACLGKRKYFFVVFFIFNGYFENLSSYICECDFCHRFTWEIFNFTAIKGSFFTFFIVCMLSFFADSMAFLFRNGRANWSRK